MEASFERDKPTQIHISKGEVFVIGTSSYSDLTRWQVTALTDITKSDFIVMRDVLEEVSVYGCTCDYEYIVPYLYVKGFITEPFFPPELHFHYYTDIEKAYDDDSSYEKQDFKDKVESLRNNGVV